MKENDEFYWACIEELRRPSFDFILSGLVYKVTRKTLQGRSNHCKYCYWACLGKCPWDMATRVKYKYCYHAYNKLKLNEAGLYGNRTKETID